MADALTVASRHERIVVAPAAVSVGEIYQMADGRAAYFTGADAASSGDYVNFRTEGVVTVTKTTSQVWLDGDPIWWDHSANSATCLEPIGSSDKDFFLGTAVDDAASAATTGQVNLNIYPHYIIDSTRDNGDTVIVKTVVGSTTVEVPRVFNRGGMLFAAFGTTAEAQKVDWISERGFALGSNWVFEALFEVETDADAAAVDVSIGVANGTHASDFDSVTESAIFHLDGGDANIDAESDDGTTEVAATDTTVDYTVGTPVRLKLDGRDPSNVKYYIDGVEYLAATTNLGNIAAATGPLKAVFHAEKSSDDSPGAYKVRMRVRTMEVD